MGNVPEICRYLFQNINVKKNRSLTLRLATISQFYEFKKKLQSYNLFYQQKTGSLMIFNFVKDAHLFQIF